MAQDMIELPGSHRPEPKAARLLNRVPSDESVTVSVYLKSDEGEEALATDRSAVRAFADDMGLTVIDDTTAPRLIKLTGDAATMERAFGTELHLYQADGRVFRARRGSLMVPAPMAERVLAVLGLDTRPIATPKIVPHRGATPPQGFLPTEIATLYGLTSLNGDGQCIGIIELGGGFIDADNEAAFAAMNLPVPSVVAVGVDGATNAPGKSDADGEVALDIQVAGGVAPGSRLAVYFAPNTTQGFVDAIIQAVHDQINRPSVLSISWGSPEDGWSGQAIAAMHAAFEDAARLGVSVCAASGDALATDGESDGKAHVDYPASDPLVLGCGGTFVMAANVEIIAETVWKSNGGGTGGGVSTLFALPDYQKQSKVPKSMAKSGGRGVPDVAGNADPNSGYRIITGGKLGIVGGTSAVAPLWAAIIAGLNAKAGSRTGQPHARLYSHSDVFRDITSGDNKVGRIGYSAQAGWDACTGLGTPQTGVASLTGMGQG